MGKLFEGFKKTIEEKSDKVKNLAEIGVAAAVIGLSPMATNEAAAQEKPQKDTKKEFQKQDKKETDKSKTYIWNGAEKIENPFSREYKTDEKFYRAVSCGESHDLSFAKKIAIMNNKNEILKEMGEIDGDKVNMSDYKIIDEKVFRQENGDYLYVIAGEIAKENVKVLE